MLPNFNILLFIGVVFPPLIYAYIIYLTSPLKTINLKTGLQYIGMGIASVLLFPFVNLLLPNWDLSPDPFKDQFFYVAPKEELFKFTSFYILTYFRNKKDEHPLTSMFYMGMVGLGFAMIENLQYLARFGPFVLKVRTFTSTLAHMFFGMFTGYWIALGKINTGKFGSRSVFGVLMANNPKAKSIIYTLIGLFCGIFYHALWNFNLSKSLFASAPIMILMIFIGLVISKFAASDIIYQNKRKIKSEN